MAGPAGRMHVAGNEIKHPRAPEDLLPLPGAPIITLLPDNAFHSEFIGEEPESHDAAPANRTDDGFVPEIFPCERVGYMYFNNRSFYTRDRKSVV